MSVSGANLDEIDRLLLNELQRDADRSLETLSELVGLSPSAVSRRIKGYKESGVLHGIVALLNPAEIGIGAHVICQIVCVDDSSERMGELKAAIDEQPEVVQLYEVAGAIDLIAIFAVPSMQRYVDLTRELLVDHPTVLRFESHVAFEVSKPIAGLAV